ncbi:MAG: hypothetical protein Unbinned5081contig1001_14 [Prokaryotic dsDNA virus sp.]|nr:MAG: hypothetical protein Unbinned5081contig1001_14 [Prokaryotic dsDNA virus sp.]|tara:strand:- start:5041 stop:5361 length:321 start_codon:yes stop_codon:yes gene_type:complete
MDAGHAVQSGMLSGAKAGNIPERPEKIETRISSAIARTVGQTNQAERVIDRMDALATRLLGSETGSPSGASEMPANGSLDELDFHSHVLGNQLMRMEELLCRLEQV